MKVGILGATGLVGQQYIQLLAHHPVYEIVFLSASKKGKTYKEAVQGKWKVAGEIPEAIASMPVHTIDELDERCDLVFSAVGSDIAKEWEEKIAQRGIGVISNASYHRLDPFVPMIIPEINPHHLEIIPMQQRERGFKLGGFIAVKSNCSIQSMLLPLAPLHHAFELKKIMVTTLQALSGAGYPGISALDMIDNVIPWIDGEEEKSEIEPLKIFGSLGKKGIISHPTLEISAHCNRVPVLDGHMTCVSAEFRVKPSLEDVLAIWQKTPMLTYLEAVDRPQPRLDRDRDKGMGVTVGRLRECKVMDLRFVALSHNVIRGAAGGGVAIADLIMKEGYARV
ncbi:MAG: aspartate-semialdehyde dehydrogenase [Simkaniaceae bacterium]|nr:aspartate-semialdehyde dehydrogenase [Simkaniaceae bacterium]